MTIQRRLAAIGALGGLVASLVLVAVGLIHSPGRLALALVCVLVATVAGWYALTRRRLLRLLAAGLVVVAVAALFVVLLSGKHHGLLLALVVAIMAGSMAGARFALVERGAPYPGTMVPPAQHGVLLINPRSGGGKADRFGLVEEASRRGVEPVVLRPDDDLLALATNAIRSGADVIGMAGGDGSQALVASVASAHDVPLVCIPAGTRNHFALDLGLDREDVVAGLDAFGEAMEHRIDLAEVSGRVFVNNVSLGVYAAIVQSPEYRDAKVETAARLLPDLLGQDASPLDLRFIGPDTTEHTSAQIIQISNNPYVLARLAGFGTRLRLDAGVLGVVAAAIHGPADIAELVACEATGQVSRFRGWLEWAAPTFVVHSSRQVEAGIDGEAVKLDPPLVFRSRPGALRVRIPTQAPGLGRSRVTPPSLGWTIRALGRAAIGRSTPIAGSASS